MKYPVIALPLLLAGCSSGDGIENSVELLDDMVDNTGLCGNVYYSELRGNYDGQIRYFSPDTTCLWNVDMQVSTTPISEPFLCRAALSMSSDLLDGDSMCSDIGIGAPLIEPFSEGQRGDGRQNITWPVDALITLESELDAGKIYPVGKSGQIGMFTVQFDGRGNITYPVSNGTDESYVGVLVKQ
ncbi:MAG: hypothetical protein AB8B64_21630 [Granulosicoccus sp.]